MFTYFFLFTKYLDLVYLGEAKYGVQMRGEDLKRCLEQSCTPEKLGLNLLEFLVSAEDCADMTVYGHGKTKKEMAPNMRRALRSKDHEIALFDFKVHIYKILIMVNFRGK